MLGGPGRACRWCEVTGWVAPAAAAALAVGRYGEFSWPAMAAVAAAGCVLAGLGLARRAGSATRAVPRAAGPWLTWLSALAGWELYTWLLNRGLPTLSDLLDPVLAHPVLRGAATLLWFAAGVWLLRRPTTTGGDR